MPPSTPRTNIPFIYRLFHLYVEPFFFVPSGIYLSFFDPVRFLVSTTPGPTAAPFNAIPPAPITPLLQLLLTNTSALYLVLALNEALVLRLTSDMRIWRSMIFSMLCCDVIHLYAVWAAGGAEFMLDFAQWRMEDWVNCFALGVGAVLRVGFLMGVGFGKGEKKKE